MNDAIGMAHMMQGSSAVTFCQDRYGTSNSAINLSNKSFAQLPSGIYFDSPSFTISVWIYHLNPITNWTRVIDLGNGKESDNIVLTVGSSHEIRNPDLTIWAYNSTITNIISPQALVSSQWQFLTGTFDGDQMHIFINGLLKNSTNITYSSTPLNRTNNYIGNSNWSKNGYTDLLLDDLRFYNKSLNQIEIMDLMIFEPKGLKFKIIHFFG